MLEGEWAYKEIRYTRILIINNHDPYHQDFTALAPVSRCPEAEAAPFSDPNGEGCWRSPGRHPLREGLGAGQPQPRSDKNDIPTATDAEAQSQI